MAYTRRPPHRENFEIAVLCALEIESDAVEASFEEVYDGSHTYRKVDGDHNSYTTGRIGNHNIVLAYLQGMGKRISASSAANFRISFPRIKLCLVAGICGGVPTIIKPDESIEVLLGDVIISTEVVQYDRGQQLPTKIVTKNTLQESLGLPNMEIQSFERKMKGLTGRKRLKDSTSENLSELLKKEGLEAYKYPGADKDRLYEPTYRHKHHDPTACNICAKDNEVCGTALESSCETLGCNTDKQVLRTRLKKPEESSANRSISMIEEGVEVPQHRIHFGKVASGDLVLKSAQHRDELASREKVIAFEMESAGVWDNLPTVVIKCVCDYADSHKGKGWQKYAAAVSAACMMAFVTEWWPTDKTSQPVAESDESALIEEQTKSLQISRPLNYEGQKNRNAALETNKDVEDAWTLLERQEKKSRKEDREAARRVLSQIRAELSQLEIVDESLLIRVYSGLMRVEMDLSCFGGHEVLPQKIQHVKKAEEYCIEVAQAVLRSGDTGAQVHVTLEQYILKGRRALLEFRQGADMDDIRRLMKDVIKGMDGALKELENTDQVRFNENVKCALHWRDRFFNFRCYRA